MITLINPNLVVQKNDPFTTGIVYMPISLAYTAAALRQADIPLTVIDAFGAKPRQGRHHGNYLCLGLTLDEIINAIPRTASGVIIYAINLNNHLSTISIIRAIKSHMSDCPVAVLENTQSVTGYSLAKVAKEFFDAGADALITGEGETRAVDWSRSLLDKNSTTIPGIITPSSHAAHSGNTVIANPDTIPFPAWDLFPLKNYWDLKFAHGPLKDKRYLPLLTSRGCPYPCRFCVIPATNGMKWRARSANNVVDEIEQMIDRFGVSEFHIEDLDPTVSDERTREICREIIRRGLKITWKIAAGTKAETIRDEETLRLMAEAGCTYISISPETGSPDLLKKMNKPFRLDHALVLVKAMNRLGIRSQACFVLGFPGETKQDRALSLELVKKLTLNGIDEIAVFIITPVPGSAIAEQFTGFKALWELTFTPTWRSDYKALVRWRLRMYLFFLVLKTLRYPVKILRQIKNFILQTFETKMEMVPFRALVWHRVALKTKG